MILALPAAVHGIAETATAAMPPISNADIVVEPGALSAAPADVAGDVAPQHVHPA